MAYLNSWVVISSYIGVGIIGFESWYFWLPLSVIGAISFVYRDEKMKKREWD